MEDRAAQIRAEKEPVARLIDQWTRRAGLQRQALASQAGFAEYNLFYQAYLDMSRPVNTDPDRAIGVVRAVTRRGAPELRATAAEALTFLARTRFPLDRLGEVYALFPAAEWPAALAALLGAADAGGAAPQSDQLDERLRRIEAALSRLSGVTPAAPADPAALLAAMPDALAEPAPLPLPHRMPLAPGRLFTGREAELLTLVRLLRAQGVGEVAAITGLGGVGKTSLASEIAHRGGRYFAGGVFWVSCAEPALIAREVAACGEAGLVAHSGWSTLPLEERVRLVMLAWQAPVPRLLIFDNCEEEAVLQRWRPTSGGCRVLLTSRRAQWSRSLGVTTLPLGEFDTVTSVALLRRYRPDLPAADAGLEAIARELGGLPLALHLAGSFLETYEGDPVLGDPARFLRDLRAPGPLAHAALQGIDVAGTTTNHDPHVERTFAISVEQLDPAVERDALARVLLAHAACLAPGEPFPAELLLLAAGAGDGGRAALRRLMDLGLLGEGEGGPRIHRLVQEAARTLLDVRASAQQVRGAIAQLTERAYHQRDTRSARQLLPHAVLLAEPGEPAGDAVVTLWNAVPFLLDMAGDLAGGTPYLERAHARLRETDRLETALGAEVLNNLAEWRRALGQGEEALGLHLQALAIREGLFPADSLTIAESHANLGDTLREQGELEGARDHYERALEIALRSGGPTHDTTLVVRGHLALLHYHQREFAQARDMFVELIPLSTAAFGPDDPRTAIVRNNLAMALFHLGEVGAARQELEQGIAALRKTLGPEHPETLRGRLNAARAAARLGATQQAVEELQAIIGPLAAVYGEEHQATQVARDTLAEAQLRLSDAPRA